VPFGLKAGLAFFLALIMWNMIRVDSFPQTVVQFIAFGAEQLIVGLCMGFMISCMFAAVQIAGEFIGMQIGFSIVNVFDPENQQPESVIAQYFYVLAVMIFFALDGHHYLIKGLYESFTSVPLNHLLLKDNVFKIILNETMIMFVTAIKISAPVVVTIMISNIGMGIIAKTVPQINVFVIGMPLNIGIGITTLYITMSVFLAIFSSSLDSTFSRVLKMLPFLNGG